MVGRPHRGRSAAPGAGHAAVLVWINRVSGAVLLVFGVAAIVAALGASDRAGDRRPGRAAYDLAHGWPTPSRVVAIVPVGTLEGAKSRLGAVLDAEERRELSTAWPDGRSRRRSPRPAIDETIVVTPRRTRRGARGRAGRGRSASGARA